MKLCQFDIKNAVTNITEAICIPTDFVMKSITYIT